MILDVLTIVFLIFLRTTHGTHWKWISVWFPSISTSSRCMSRCMLHLSWYLNYILSFNSFMYSRVKGFHMHPLLMFPILLLSLLLFLRPAVPTQSWQHFLVGSGGERHAEPCFVEVVGEVAYGIGSSLVVVWYLVSKRASWLGLLPPVWLFLVSNNMELSPVFWVGKRIEPLVNQWATAWKLLIS